MTGVFARIQLKLNLKTKKSPIISKKKECSREAVHDVLVTKFRKTALISYKEWLEAGGEDPCTQLSGPSSVMKAYPNLLDFDTGGMFLFYL